MKLSGFTYIEVILSVALMLYIAVAASPFYGNFLFGQEADMVTKELRSSLIKARLYSMSGKEGDSWGVAIDRNAIVLFKGSAYGADTSFNEQYLIPDRISLSGPQEIIFSARTGLPNTEGVFSVSMYTNADTGASHTHILRVNAIGVVEENF